MMFHYKQAAPLGLAWPVHALPKTQTTKRRSHRPSRRPTDPEAGAGAEVPPMPTLHAEVPTSEEAGSWQPNPKMWLDFQKRKRVNNRKLHKSKLRGVRTPTGPEARWRPLQPGSPREPTTSYTGTWQQARIRAERFCNT